MLQGVTQLAFKHKANLGKGKKMTREVLFLDLIETEGGEGAPPRMRLVVGAYPSDEKGYASLTPECNTMEGFEQAGGRTQEEDGQCPGEGKGDFSTIPGPGQR